MAFRIGPRRQSAGLTAGTLFGRYRIVRALGQGGMGAVYLAHDTLLDRSVALKIPYLPPGSGPQVPERFYREARLAAALDHPNLCPVYDVGERQGVPYLTMAYIEGRPLSEFIGREQALPQRQVAAVTRKLALALQEAHDHGVIHRDLKPANVLVSPKRDLVIVDFGLAWRHEQGDARLTSSGVILGTPAYMSPEHVAGETGTTGVASDIYSLGVILYEMLTGRVPFEGSAALVLGKIMVEQPEPLSGLRPDIDPQLEAICLKAMARKPDDRYATMGDFAAALSEYLRGSQEPPELSLPEAPAILPSSADATDARPAAGAESLVAQFVGRFRSQPTAEWPPAEPVSAAKPGAIVELRRRRVLRRLAVAAAGAAASLCLFAAIIYLATDRGTVKIERSHQSTKAVVKVDGMPSSIAPSNRPTATRYPDLVATKAGEIRLKLIPSGQFEMGSLAGKGNENEHPQHEVRINAFYLGATEVTRGQFRHYVDATGYRTDAEKSGVGGEGWNAEIGKFEHHPRYTWRNTGFEQTDDHPVVNVSWNDAMAFCEWLSRVEDKTYRLPTEAEWEYACRAGTTTDYWTGDDPEALASVANVADATAKSRYPNWRTIRARDGYVYTAPVGEFQPNSFGLFDMHGNVWEWCQDPYDAQFYSRSPMVNPRGPAEGTLRVLRGGSWIEWRPVFRHDPRSAARNGEPPDYRGMNVGFRLAGDVPDWLSVPK
jgi:eukaryotic-like serine/threonine-protein kinase